MTTGDDIAHGKGRPTPSRKEAEAARRQKMKSPATRKGQAKAQRARQVEARRKMRDGMDRGEERYMPARDAGPVRRFARDYIDRRYGFAEFLLPLLVIIMVLSIIDNPSVQSASVTLWMVTILGTVLDTIFLVIGLKRAARRRFPNESLKGLTFYTVLRSSQLRMLRVPKPQLKRGEPLDDRY